jgi:DNA polymerase III epsilon subunit-like protein
MKRYIALDVESGGIKSDLSLLTVYLEVLDNNLETLDSLSLLVKPDDGIYRCTAEALEINGIDLVKHDKEAVTEKIAGTKLYNFLKAQSSDGHVKLIPLGQNVTFDIKFLQTHLMSQGTWEKFVSYRVRDTGVLGGALLDAGLIPASVSGSLSSFAQYFGVNLNHAHNAESDTRATIEVYKKMIALLKR